MRDDKDPVRVLDAALEHAKAALAELEALFNAIFDADDRATVLAGIGARIAGAAYAEAERTQLDTPERLRSD